MLMLLSIHSMQIVANHDYNVDVDKMDYLARDCHGLGIEMKFCWK